MSLAKKKAELAERLALVEKLYGRSIKGNVTESEATLSTTVDTPTGTVKQDLFVKRVDDKLYVSITNEVAAGSASSVLFGLASLAALDPDEDFAKQMKEKVENIIQVEPGKCKFI
jgi:hypothetical protein